MKIVEVLDHKQRKEFLDVAKIIYKNDSNYACPLDGEIEGIFDPNQNSFFQHGKAIRWVLKNDNGELIGRIAAFINNRKAFSFDQPTGGLWFFRMHQ